MIPLLTTLLVVLATADIFSLPHLTAWKSGRGLSLLCVQPTVGDSIFDHERVFGRGNF